MRSLFQILLSLAVVFGAADRGACNCGCGGVGVCCPCEHPEVMDASPEVSALSASTAPADSNCSIHESNSSPGMALPTDNQLEQRTNALLSAGKAFGSIYHFSEYLALQTQFALRLDLLRGPPRQNVTVKTNTRLAALSILRI